MPFEINTKPVVTAESADHILIQQGSAPGNTTAKAKAAQFLNTASTVIVNSTKDLPTLQDTGDGNGLAYHLADETVYVFKAGLDLINPLVIPVETALGSGCCIHGHSNGRITYAGPGALIRGSSATATYIYEIFLVGAPGTTLFDFDGGSNFIMEGAITRGFDSLGNIDNTAFCIIERVGFNGYTAAGLTINGGLDLSTGFGTILSVRDTSFIYLAPMFGGTSLRMNGIFTLIQLTALRGAPIVYDYLLYFNPSIYIINGLINDSAIIDILGGTVFAPGSLDQTDPRFIYTGNLKVSDSQSVAESKALTNATHTVGTLNVPIKVAATFVVGYTERFSSDTTGRHTYTGITPVTKRILATFRATIDSGTNRDWIFYIAQGNEKNNFITSFEISGGNTKVNTLKAHGLPNGALVRLYGTTNYNASYIISAVTSTSFEIPTAFIADDTLTPAIAISSFVDNGDGNTLVNTGAAHGLVTNDYGKIYGTTNYNGVWSILSAPTTTSFVIDTTFVGNDGVGNVAKLTEKWLLLSSTNEALMGNRLSSGDYKVVPIIANRNFVTNDFVEIWGRSITATCDGIFDLLSFII